MTGRPDFHASSAAWPAIIDGILFLAAEAAAGLHLDDADLLVRQVEQRRERFVDVVRALHRAPHRHAVLRIGDGDHAVRLDVELLLRAGLVLAFDDDRRRPRSAVSTSPLLT